MKTEDKIMLCSDLDRTIIPNGKQDESPGARQALRALAARREILLLYVTGRDRHLIAEAIETYELPVPDYAVGDVGTSIYKIEGRPGSLEFEPMHEWQEEISGDWNGWTHEDLAAQLQDISALRYQEEDRQNSYKVSYYVDADADRKALMGEIRKRLDRIDVKAAVISSIDEENQVGLIDILPERATKVHAIRFIMRNHNIPESRVVFSGDSGNDLPALTSGLQAVLVKNASDDVRREAQQKAAEKGIGSRLYMARGGYRGMNGNYAAGVLEGLVHFMPETDRWISTAPEEG